MGRGILGVCLALCLLAGCSGEAPREVPEEATVLFAGTQEDADCTILLSGEGCAVIDAGEREDGPHVVELLEEQGVDSIDCLILTHPDKDHVGGVPALLEAFPVTEILTSCYEKEDKKTYQEALQAAAQQKVPVRLVTSQRRGTVGDLVLEVFPARERSYKKSNNYSLALLARHGEVTLFLAGDAEKKRIGELLELPLPEEVDLYQVARHGRDGKRGPELIQRLSPAVAVVNAREPEPEIRQALETVGAAIYPTVGQDVCFSSDGRILTLQRGEALS